MTDRPLDDVEVPDHEAVAANLRNWDSRVPGHVTAYDLERYVTDASRRSTVVRTDLPHLGDLSGRRVVHLQCHLGTDSVSLARAGATVTGVDFSSAALVAARDLVARTGDDVRFVEAAIAEVPEVLAGERFDLVYTTVGVLGWLPSMSQWARVAAGLLRPGGRLYVRDGHPMLLTLEERDDLLVVTHPHGSAHGPQRWEDTASYTGDAHLDEPVTYEWNHGLGDVVQAVLDAGLVLTELWEGDALDWRALPGLVARDVDVGDGEVVTRYVLADRPQRLPLEFRLQAVAPS